MHHFNARVPGINFKVRPVISPKPHSHPIFKIIGQLNPRAKFNRSAQINACSAGIEPRHRMQLHIDTVDRCFDGIGMADSCPSIACIANRHAIYVLERTMSDFSVAANINLCPKRIIVESRFTNSICGITRNLTFLKTIGFAIILGHVPKSRN